MNSQGDIVPESEIPDEEKFKGKWVPIPQDQLASLEAASKEDRRHWWTKEKERQKKARRKAKLSRRANRRK